MGPWQLLAEYFTAPNRIDATGVYGGLNRPLTVNADDFPYDDTNPAHMYGTPQAYDRGSAKGRDGSGRPPTPRDTKDILHDDDKIELDLDEVGGYPMIARKDGGGGSGGGRTVPGTSGAWSRSPADDFSIKDPLGIDDDPEGTSPLKTAPGGFEMGNRIRQGWRKRIGS